MTALLISSTHRSLSSLLTDESLLSTSRSRSLSLSRSLSWELTDALRSGSPGLSQGGGVGKDGGVLWSLFHGSWGPLKCCCASLWPNTEFGAGICKNKNNNNMVRFYSSFFSISCMSTLWCHINPLVLLIWEPHLWSSWSKVTGHLKFNPPVKYFCLIIYFLSNIFYYFSIMAVFHVNIGMPMPLKSNFWSKISAIWWQ